MKWVWNLSVVLLLFSCKKEFPDVQTEVLGHAGESVFKSRSKYPPNTTASVQEALNLGADGVEVDVQLTADHVLVAYHDYLLEENTDVSGCINNMTYEQLSAIQVYNSDFTIERLENVIAPVVNTGKFLMLDIKHFNPCKEKAVDYTILDSALSAIFSGYSTAQKERVMVNCRDIQLFNTLTDSVVIRSYESDDVDAALPQISNLQLDLLTIKLESLHESSRQLIESEGIGVAVYGVKSRSDINKALQFNPEFVISDNITCTLKAIHG